MRKKVFLKKACSILLAGALVTTSINYVGPYNVYAQKGEGTVYATRTFDSSFDAEYAYTGNDLGCTYTKEKTTFKVWSPIATQVKLCRYEKGNGGSLIEEVNMTKGEKGVWSCTISGDIVNTYYTYKVTANDKTKEAVDIYAKATGVNGDRAMVVDLDSTDPENWDTSYEREKTNLSDIIVWEVHIRDFSIDVSSGVSEANRGKYKAFTESTTLNGEGKIATCVDYLKELGVTHVQLMPMYDYASVDETKVTNSLSDSNYNWGYDPENYNVPEGSYSSNPYDGNVRITEMKEMIQALHDAGIKVVMDVVYNHTYDTEDSNFNKIVPDYYYKLNGDKSYNDNSGCGNATRSESAMYRKFMIDSISYWAEEYNIDGFRFDLMGIHDVTTMNQIRSTLDTKFGKNTIVMYGEGWTGDGNYTQTSAHKANESALDSGIGYFNDQIRDALKGEHKFDRTIGLLQTNYVSGSYLEPGAKWPNNVFGGIMGSVGYTEGQYGMWRPFWSKSTDCSVSYASAHDNLTLWDKLTEGFGKQYGSTDQKLINMNKMCGGIILTSKGGTFMQAGEEFARTKNGDDNSYNAGDYANKIDWNNLSKYSSIWNFYKGMISLRKAFSGFSSIMTRSGDNWNPNNNNMTWISKDETGLIAFYETNAVDGEWNKVAVLINNATSEKSVTLTGASSFVVVADGTNAGLSKIRETSSNVTVPAKSVMVVVPKDTFDANKVKENKEPIVNVQKSFEVAEGEKVEFNVNVSDPDGDSVTLEAKGLPTGAKFDLSTKTFSWTNAAVGDYEVTFEVSDGKATVKKTVKIIVIGRKTALNNLISEVEAKEYKKDELSLDIYSRYVAAYQNAKAISEKADATDAQIESAKNTLDSAYELVEKELEARASLLEKIELAQVKLKEAKEDKDNYDAEAIADLELVISMCEEYAKKAHSEEEYTGKTEDITAAYSACVSNKKNPTIKVKADGWSTPAIYVWTGTGASAKNLSGEWPGTVLTTKDSDGYYVYDLPEGTTAYNVIVNDSKPGTSTQTSDIVGIDGNVEITVTSFTGKTCSYTKTVTPINYDSPVIDKELLKSTITKANACVTKYADKSGILKELNKLKEELVVANELNSKEDATQVQINKEVRELKSAIEAVVNAKEEVTESSSTEKETESSSTESTSSEKETESVSSSTESTSSEKETETVSSSTESTSSEKETESVSSSTESTSSEKETESVSTSTEKITETEDSSKDESTESDSTTKVTQKPTESMSIRPTEASSDIERPTESETEANTNTIVIKSLKTSKKSKAVNAGTKIELSVDGTGGSGKLKYKFYVEKNGVTIVKNYSTSKSATWTPNKSGTYKITVVAKDEKGNTRSKTISKFTVNPKVKVSIYRMSASDKNVKLTVKATGGSKKYSYRFAYKLAGKNKVVALTKYTSKRSLSFTPRKSGKYTVYVYVKDVNAKTTTKKALTTLKIK